jgi:acetolactate synthase-1/3 small subunit
LERLVPVHSVANLTLEGAHIERELALMKVVGKKEKRIEALQIADSFRAKTVDTTLDSFVFELTGSPEKIDAFIDLMRPLGLIEISRTGIAAMSRGKEAL